MRPERDIEQVLDAWLAPGPTQMPDRLFGDVLDRIERAPQRRIARPTARFIPMPSTLKLPIVAAVAALLLGLGTIALWQDPSKVGQAPGPSPSPSPVPTALETMWIGSPRTVDGLSLNDVLAQWTVADDTFAVQYLLDPDADTDLSSSVSVVGPDAIRLTSSVDGEGCPIGAEGTYSWTLSHGGTRMTMTPVDDACPARAAFLTGDWSKSSCEIGTRACMGVLEAGRYEAGAFDPSAQVASPIRARMGAFTFAVPEGWAADDENLSSYALMPADDFDALVADPEAGVDMIHLFARAVELQPYEGSGCRPRVLTRLDDSVRDIAERLWNDPRLTASTPAPITIDGHEGLMLDVDIDPTVVPTSACFDGKPGVPLFANFGAFDGSTWTTDAVYGDSWRMGIGGGQTDPLRIILLPTDGGTLVIAIDAWDPAHQTAFVEQAMPIVESFTFPEA